MSPTRAITSAARQRVRHCRTLAGKCAEKPARRRVHKLRTESRRLLADLELIAARVPPAALQQGRRTVKKMLKATAKLRDIHVQLRLAKSLARTQPALEPFREYLREQRRRGAKSAATALARPKLRHRLADLDNLARLAGNRRAAGIGHQASGLRATLTHSYARCVELRRGAADSEGLHRLRLALKKYCYLAEALLAHLPEISKPSIERLNALRSRMGEAHDLAELEKAVAKFGENSRARVQQPVASIRRRRLSVEASCRRTAAKLLRG